MLFPDHLLKLAVLPQADYAAALARAYNAWLIDQWTSRHPALLAAIVACPQDPDDAAREIERYADEPSVVAVYLPCAGLDPLWGHRRYDPIFDAAQNARPARAAARGDRHLAGLPVQQPRLRHRVRAPLDEPHVLDHRQPHLMVSTGVVVRFPDLRIGVTEAGISWMPFVCNRLDKEYLERRREVPFLTERPSHYLKRVYVATQPIEEPERLRDLVTLMELYDGEDTTVFASDWPHHDFDHPMKLDQVPFTRRAEAQGVRRERAGAVRDRRDGAPRVTDVVVGGSPTSPRGRTRSSRRTGARIGVFNIGGRLLRAAQPSARTRPGRCARAQRRPARCIADAESGWRPRWVMEDEVIACPWHGLEYHVPTGRCLAYPEITLRRYAVTRARRARSS